MFIRGLSLQLLTPQTNRLMALFSSSKGNPSVFRIRVLSDAWFVCSSPTWQQLRQRPRTPVFSTPHPPEWTVFCERGQSARTYVGGIRSE